MRLIQQPESDDPDHSRIVALDCVSCVIKIVLTQLPILKRAQQPHRERQCQQQSGVEDLDLTGVGHGGRQDLVFKRD